MRCSVLLCGGLTAALALSIPGAAAAAEPQPAEGIDWHLVEYPVDLTSWAPVPWYLDATLRLDDGVATGSTGCRSFSAEYTLGEDRLSITDIEPGKGDCAIAARTVETAYLAALADARDWFATTGPRPGDLELHVFGQDGIPLLRFQPAMASLTPADIAALAAQLESVEAAVERVDQRVDSIRIGSLRERIRALETGAAVPVETETPADTSFNAAERVLLEGIPAHIRRTCEPRRTENPAGTIAAVQCKPSTSKVKDMAYYLMEGEDASRTWTQRMKENGAWRSNGVCRKGKTGTAADTGGLSLAGCYRNADGLANLRYAVDITDCKELQAGDTRVGYPALYIAVLGPDGDLARLTKWAESEPYGGARDLIEDIKRPQEAWSNACPR